ncbi:Zinc finger, CCCH-type [Sesbania bispinosa]|nr:Zinc finger, CCCH-type [Sesbania bispinosa]
MMSWQGSVLYTSRMVLVGCRGFSVILGTLKRERCRKKHSYVCPIFEATGTCTHGTKCKLHHPKKQSKGKKRKRSEDENSRGRYFGSIPIDVSEPGMMMPPRQRQHKDDLENELSNFIGLDVNEEVTHTVYQSFEQSTFCDNESLELQLDTSDELIKPVFLITKFTSQSSQFLEV